MLTCEGISPVRQYESSVISSIPTKLNLEKLTLNDLAEDTGSEGSHFGGCNEYSERCKDRI